MNNQYKYILLFIIIGFSSCNLFETEIVEDRSSFFKIYPKGNLDYNAINGDYLVNTDEGFLLGASLTPQNAITLSNLIRVSHTGSMIEKKDISFSLETYKKIIPSNNGQDFYFIGADHFSKSYIAKMSLEDAEPAQQLGFGSNIIPIDFDILPNNSLISITQKSDDFPQTLELKHLDDNLNIIWEREFSFENTSFLGLCVIHEPTTGHFIVLGKNGINKLFIIEVNEFGNLVNTRFFEEFGFESINILANTGQSYEPVLLNMGTHYMVIEKGRLYTKTDGSPFSAIYRIDKDLSNITRLETNTEFEGVSTVQSLDNEILINGFVSDSTFAIKKLDSDGNLLKWANGEDFITFDMNLATQFQNGSPIFDSSPSLGDYNDFFVPGNIVKTTDGGYAMIGTYGIFNGDDFESVATLFKFRSDGSY